MANLAKIRSTCKASRRDLAERTKKFEIVQKKQFPLLEKLFLPWQIDWITDDVPFAIAEKGRQSGFSTAQAFRSTMLAINGIKSTYYSTYSLPACRNFIRRVGNAAKAFNYITKTVTNKEIIDEREITSFKVTFPNGLFVEAIAGDAKNLRDRTNAELVIDEAAFRPSGLKEIIKAGLANLIWGVGSIRCISTHNGEDNDFNQECRKLEENPELGHLHKITFRETVALGLYRQICVMTGQEWTQEKEDAWVESWYKKYGEGAKEELDVIPSKYGSKKYFKEEYFHTVRLSDDDRMNAIKIRGWDLAATDKSKATKGTFYTANLLAYLINNTLVIIDGDARQLGATEGNDWIVTTSKHDTRDTMVLLEQEPGSTGIKFIEFMENVITTRSVVSYTPQTSKDVRAMPLAGALKGRQIVFDEDMNTETYQMIKNALCGFDGTKQPLISDITDVLSMIYDYSCDNFAWLMND